MARCISVCTALGACTSISSQFEDAPLGPVPDGVVYYMPKRPIDVAVTVDASDAKKQTAALVTVDMVPDLSRRFILRPERNLSGQNHLGVTANSKGLLSTSNAETTSGVKDIAENIAKAVAAANFLAVNANKANLAGRGKGAKPRHLQFRCVR
jgi:hypothetical protein